MRPIAPLDITGITPADLSGMKQPTFEIVDAKDLWVEDEEGAQREFTEKSQGKALSIVRDFRWRNFVVPTVARVNGRLLVLNGQTTATACASHPEITAILVLVVDAPDITDRASAFVSHSRDSVRATPAQIWRGLVTAGDPEAVLIKEVCEAAGVDLVPFPPAGSAYKPGQTIALAQIRRLVRLRGALKATTCLRALVGAELTPITAEWIKAGDALLHDDEYASEMDGDRLMASIKALGPRAYADIRELSAAKHLPGWRATVAVVFKNRARRTPRVVPVPEAPATPPPLPRPTPVSVGPAVHGITKTTTGGRVIDRRPTSRVCELGELPGPGRSALDKRKAAQ